MPKRLEAWTNRSRDKISAPHPAQTSFPGELIVRDDRIVILAAPEIDDLLCGKEKDIIEITRRAYLAHADGLSSLPHSTFLRFPEAEKNRIIALSAYLGGEFELAGIKWISSFPENIQRGRDRASAVIVLNSLDHGRPEAILEGSLISAKRTAASAALATQHLADLETTELGLIGCGVINSEILRFIHVLRPQLEKIFLFDLDPRRSRECANRCQEHFPALTFEIARDMETVFKNCRLISFATTAATPHLMHDSVFSPGTVILHISLRDLGPEIILKANNIVDDIDHVCRAQTSIHLAEQQVQHREFITGTIAQVISGSVKLQSGGGRKTIFSPFGLGILDLAVAAYVHKQANGRSVGTEISNFFPGSVNSAAYA